MSYILDALKRSEQERHQGELTHASIDTIMIPKRQVKNQWWPYVIIVLLMVNIAAYLYFQLQTQSEDVSIVQASSVVESIENSPAIPPETKNEKSLKPSLPVNSLVLSQPTNGMQTDIKAEDQSEESQFRALPEHVLNTPQFTQRFELPPLQDQSSDFEEQSVELTEDGMEIVRPKKTNEPSADFGSLQESISAVETQAESLKKVDLVKPKAVTTNPVITPSQVTKQTTVHQVDNFDNVRHLSDLDESFQKSIPDIRFNSHIYASNPEDRRVMINDLYLREKQMFSGMTIQTIGEFYIVLEKEGQTFKIPVLRDWYSPK